MRATSKRWATGVALAGLLPLCACRDSPGPPPRAAVVIAALGDSFSSGEGAPPYDATPKTCKRSDQGWARRLEADAATVRSLDLDACSGAHTTHLLSPWTSRGLPPQIPATPRPDVTLVTLTIGGNDVGFGNILATCVVLSCADVPTSPGFLGVVHALTATLRLSVYPALERAYPNAKIVHVGYPRLTPAPGRPVQGCLWLGKADQTAGAELVRALNDAIRTATIADPAVTYLDTTNALTGHELCTASSWLHPVGFNATSAAHPTSAGQRALEQVIASALHISI
jgi:lysophospholipase L1-like esterase